MTRLTIDFLSARPARARRGRVEPRSHPAAASRSSTRRSHAGERTRVPRARRARAPRRHPRRRGRARRRRPRRCRRRTPASSCRCSRPASASCSIPTPARSARSAASSASGAVAAWIRLRGELAPRRAAVAARARRRGRRLRQRPELDPAVSRLAVRQHRARRSTCTARPSGSGSASTRGHVVGAAGSASRPRRCTTCTGRSASARSRCSSSRADAADRLPPACGVLRAETHTPGTCAPQPLAI